MDDAGAPAPGAREGCWFAPPLASTNSLTKQSSTRQHSCTHECRDLSKFVLYCIVLHCIELFCIVCIALYCIVGIVCIVCIVIADCFEGSHGSASLGRRVSIELKVPSAQWTEWAGKIEKSGWGGHKQIPPPSHLIAPLHSDAHIRPGLTPP